MNRYTIAGTLIFVMLGIAGLVFGFWGIRQVPIGLQALAWTVLTVTLFYGIVMLIALGFALLEMGAKAEKEGAE